MMFLHNFGNLMPPNRNENPGIADINLARAVKHSAIAMMPESVEVAQPGNYLVNSPFFNPPSFIAGSLFVKTYKLNYNINYSGSSVAGSNIMLATKSGEYEIETLGERISHDYMFSRASHLDFSDSGANFSFVWNSHIIRSILWLRPEEKWVFGGTLFILANSNDAVSDSEASDQYPASGITYTYLGREIPLFARTVEALNISGTVTVEAEEFLSPL